MDASSQRHGAAGTTLRITRLPTMARRFLRELAALGLSPGPGPGTPVGSVTSADTRVQPASLHLFVKAASPPTRRAGTATTVTSAESPLELNTRAEPAS